MLSVKSGSCRAGDGDDGDRVAVCMMASCGTGDNREK